MQPEVKQIQTFLSALHPDAGMWCWHVQPKGEGGARPQFHQSVEGALTLLSDWNELGAAIFVTINETDGTGRRTENIIRVRAVFVDLDGAPIEPVLQGRLKPHLVVNTSPNKYHAYWLAADVPLDWFKPLQEALIAKFNGDKSVKDLVRVMRVPGFYHCKAEPYMVTCERLATRPPYSLAELREWLAPAKPVKYKAVPMPDHLPLAVTRILPTLVDLGLHVRESGGGIHEITCPWAHHHTMGGKLAGYFEPSEKNNWKGAFKCLHSHCSERKIKDLARFVELSLEKAHD